MKPDFTRLHRRLALIEKMLFEYHPMKSSSMLHDGCLVRLHYQSMRRKYHSFLKDAEDEISCQPPIGRVNKKEKVMHSFPYEEMDNGCVICNLLRYEKELPLTDLLCAAYNLGVLHRHYESVSEVQYKKCAAHK